MKPRNSFETAVSTCDLLQLEKELGRLKLKEPDFEIGKHVRTDFDTTMSLMRFGLGKLSLSKSAKEFKMVTVLKFLAARGLEFSGTGKKLTSLMRQARNGNLKMCKFLIDQVGTIINSPDGADGKTAFHHACSSTNSDAHRVVRLLLDNNIVLSSRIIDQVFGLARTYCEPGVFKALLTSDCVKVEDEIRAEETIRVLLLHINTISTDVLKEVILQMYPLIPNKMDMVVKTQLYSGCRMVFLPTYNAAIAYWTTAKVMKNVIGLIEGGSGGFDFNPFAGSQEFFLEMVKDGNAWIRVYGTYFHLMSDAPELMPSALICRRLWTDIGGHLFGNIMAEHRYYVDILRGLLDPKFLKCKTKGPVLDSYVGLLAGLCLALLKAATDDDQRQISFELIARVAKTKVLDSHKNTVLHLATWYLLPNSSFEAVKVMLKHASDVPAKNAYGITALQHYVYGSGNNLQMSAIQSFVDRGAHVDERYAYAGGNARVCNELVTRKCDGFFEGAFINLKCLAARAVVDHDIRYLGKVPRTLHKFIEIHE